MVLIKQMWLTVTPSYILIEKWYNSIIKSSSFTTWLLDIVGNDVAMAVELGQYYRVKGLVIQILRTRKNFQILF